MYFLDPRKFEYPKRTCKDCGTKFKPYVHIDRLPHRCLSCHTAAYHASRTCSLCGSFFWRYSDTRTYRKPTRRCVRCIDAKKPSRPADKSSASYQRVLQKAKEDRAKQRAEREAQALSVLDKFCPKCETTKLIEAFEPTQTGYRKNCMECNKSIQKRMLTESYRRRATRQAEARGGKTKAELRRERLLAYYATNPERHCKTCGEDKPLDRFIKSNEGLSGRGYRCKVCERARRREAARQKTLTRHIMEPPRFAQSEAERKAKRREYKTKYRQDPMHRLNRNFSEQIRKQLRNMRQGKSCGGWKPMVGYTLLDLKRHIEAQFKPGMSWENYGAWHIDHIKPKSAFKFTSADDPQFKECWALENLQPLWAEENITKGATHEE